MRWTWVALIGAAVIVPAQLAAAQFAFTDAFTSGPSPLWSNLRGNWATHDGVYDAGNPTNAPTTATMLTYSLADVTLDVDINGISDGGIWLRTDAGAHNGVLLVTGGGGWGPSGSQGGNSLYFHEIHNDGYSGAEQSVPLGVPTGSNVHLHITVTGNTYSVYLNGSPTPATTLVTPDFPYGRVGLYDFSTLQTFDNVSITSTTLPGDANHNGRIDADDFAITDRGYLKHLTDFSNGDFNADHVVDAADYAIIDEFYARQLPHIAGPLMAVPEPAVGFLFLLTAATRRRPTR